MSNVMFMEDRMGHEVKVYPHNDLLNLSHHNLQTILDKEKLEASQGIGLDCMNLINSLAFSVESLINFVGFKVIQDWKERSPFHIKIAALEEALGFRFDKDNEPYKTLIILKENRDKMAHGKPIIRIQDASSREALVEAMKSPWDDFINPEFAKHAYEQVKEFEILLMTLAKIDVFETLTSGTAVY